MNPLVYLIERLMKPRHEPEYEEVVEHDTVMEMVEGELVEVSTDDPEIRQ
ncbi:MAG: hypothetical protein IJS25_07320 [Bacteroidales bacterium]|nr:hypothetical protein [Bacteroidales bacterium]